MTTTRLAAQLLALLISLALGSPLARAQDKPDFSAAERLLFMGQPLRGLQAPTTLRYSFRKSGALEPGFDDSVGVALSLQADGRCCVGQGSFLSGARSERMPELEGGEGNPVTMYFLEHDVRDMQRLTKGSQNYFRKRIRMALYNAATVREVSLNYQGQPVAGQEVTISPYLDDPNRARYEKFIGKQYRFLLSDAVPGGVFGIRTRIDAPGAGQPPLLVEELWLEGAERSTP